jgi:ABC-type amino acid transport substrate-binding protein
MINKDHQLHGLSIDIWSAICQILGYKYELIEMKNNDDQNILDLSKGMIDVFLGPVTMTYYRTESVAFTRPYAINYIGIVVPVIKKSFQEMLFSFVKDFLSISLFIAFVGLIAYAHLLWFLERGKLDVIPTPYAKGVSHLFWTTLVRMGKIMPTTAAAKIVHFLWILGSAALLSLLYATIITSVHFSYVNEPVVINAKLDHVTALTGTAAYDYAKNAGYQVIGVSSRQEGINMVLDKKAQGYVDDETAAYYYLREHHLLNKLELSPRLIKTNILGIALPIGSPLLHKINEALSYLQDQGIAFNFCKKHLGATRASAVCF